MSNSGSDRDRHPQNLQGLLRLSVEAGTVGDGLPELHPMPEQLRVLSRSQTQRRQWLQEALADAFDGQLDELKQMKQCLQILSELSDEEPNGEGRKERALDLVADLCENLDNARDFCKLDGMKLVVETLLECAEPELRWRSAHLIGTCSQNNPFVQQCALRLGTMQPLLQLLNGDRNQLVRIKALFAVSCLVREQEAGLQEFVDHDGFSVLMRAMQSGIEKLKVKAAFLLQNLLGSHPEHKDVLCSMGMVQQLVSLIQTEHEAFHEHILGALYSLVSNFPRGVRQCQVPELGLEMTLTERVRTLKNQEEFQEELEFCEQLLRTCFNSQTDDKEMDR